MNNAAMNTGVETQFLVVGISGLIYLLQWMYMWLKHIPTTWIVFPEKQKTQTKHGGKWQIDLTDSVCFHPQGL